MKLVILLLTFSLWLFVFQVEFVSSQELRPPQINIAEGKKITATWTCGERYDKVRELFCKMATVPGKFGIHGLACDYCQENHPTRDHSIELAIDGTERWWQSPPLSRGLEFPQYDFEKINITIDLEQEYQVAYVIVKTGNAPRPKVWALERSVDGGRTFTPWEYFAPTPNDCSLYFRVSQHLPEIRDDTVICNTKVSDVPPFENGEIHISLVNGRPGASNFTYSKALQQWTRATHVRLRLLKVTTLLSDLIPLAKKDETVMRRYFYSIKDISIGGVCMCNGHADMCNKTENSREYKCNCRHNTCGRNCERCCPPFIQKKWRPATKNDNFECEPCNCHNHATECYYSDEAERRRLSLDIYGKYEGGGVCINCQHNTAGVNCERCKPGYYKRPNIPITSPFICAECKCDIRYSTRNCEDDTGNCICLPNYRGPRCTECNNGFYDFPNCKPCICSPTGTAGNVCGPTNNQCPCRRNYAGARCDQCAPGYYGFPECRPCRCDRNGALSNDCNIVTGQCRCNSKYTGRQCNECNRGFFNFPECRGCNCDTRGTGPDICERNTGRCICLPRFAGDRCDRCRNGFYDFPRCRACLCSREGSVSVSCGNNGVCQCKDNYIGTKCNNCQIGYYDYPDCRKCACDSRGSINPDLCNPNDGQCTCKGSFRGQNCNLCQEGYYGFPNCVRCRCNPAGIKPIPGKPLGDCSSSNTGQCDCKEHVTGIECSECKPGFINLRAENPLGCESCSCNPNGVIGGLRVCDRRSGQCPCKFYAQGVKCGACRRGFYGLRARNFMGCTGCDCDVGGALDQDCDSRTGQCKCRANIIGRDCSRPAPLFFYPTLHHIKVEMEDGHTSGSQSVIPGGDTIPGGDVSRIRFSYDERLFPDYSWRGYAVISDLQRTVKVALDIPKTSRYFILFRYMLNQANPVTGRVTLSPVGGSGVQQSNSVTFQPTTSRRPLFVATADGGQNTQFQLTAGRWNLVFEAPLSNLLLDYAVALPQEYYDAYILKEKVTKPCQVNDNGLCNHFSFISTARPNFLNVELEEGFIMTRRGLIPTQVFDDSSIMQQLDMNAMAYLNATQKRVTANTKFKRPGKYVIIVQYFHDSDDLKLMDVYLRSYANFQRGRVLLTSCRYKFGCRQVVIDENYQVKVFNVPRLQQLVVTLVTAQGTNVALDSVTAIPLEEWNLEFVKPSLLCTIQNNKCIDSKYPTPKDTITVDIADEQSPAPPSILDPNAKPKYLQGPTQFYQPMRVPEFGKYAIVIHYYQSKHTSFNAPVTVTANRIYRGAAKFKYCPDLSGCRVALRNNDGTYLFDINRLDVTLQMTVPSGSSAWIDYVMLIPEDKFTPNVLEASVQSLSQMFIKNCGKDHFFVKTSAEPFCRESVFSLTSHFNDGAWSCDCHPRGSFSEQCKTFGGQCPCRPNVIGRKCTRCKTGYFGFPDCRKCDCPFCDENTGDCKCPANTIGQNCSVCRQGFCFHHPIRGCQSCECDRLGVENNNLACDPKTCQCRCKPSHQGLRCNECANGYYGYPICWQCDCDPRGITDTVCNRNLGNCTCKAGVTGWKCDKCAEGYFDLQSDSTTGCKRCWCSGLTNKCTEGDMYWSVQRLDQRVWETENIPSLSILDSTGLRFANVNSQRINKSEPIYWVLHRAELGAMLHSYSGRLNYTVGYRIPASDISPELTVKPDVILIGENGIRIQYKKKLKLRPELSMPVSVKLIETEWEESGSGRNLTRDEFMRVLSHVKSLKIRASYSTVVQYVSLDDVSLEVAVPQNPGSGARIATGVEKCECPPQATGPSCEDCSSGFTRGPDNRTCVPCQCNGHSNICDPQTGECRNCQHNTKGPKCELCAKGFYGNATVGGADACQMCKCPLGLSTNNFATDCALGTDGNLKCECKKGYTGEQCQRCDNGYYGNPTTPGGFCQPCDCNGNIDLSVNGSCDPLTGVCKKCVNGTTGDKCQHCRKGYFGDAVTAKNCVRCKCNNCGATTSVCNATNGACTCKPNVVGDTCATCKPNTWNFDSCLGCEDCGCSAASNGQSCDSKTGQCSCKDGVTGRTCDRCRAGFWDYTDQGCQPCNCPGGPENLWGFCDVNTGQCCVPGGNCTICPLGYRLTENGCEYCGDCVKRLLALAKAMDYNVTEVLNRLKKGAAGIFAEQKLNNINETLHSLIPPTNKYSMSMDKIAMFIGLKDNVSNKTLANLIEAADERAMNTHFSAGKVLDKSRKATQNATSSKEEALILEEEVRNALNKTQAIISLAERTAELLKVGTANQSMLVEEGEKILKELRKRDFTQVNQSVSEEYRVALNALENARQMLNDTLELHKQALDANKTLEMLRMKFQQTFDTTMTILERVVEAEQLNKESKMFDPETILQKARQKQAELMNEFMGIQSLMQSASDKLVNATENFDSFNGSFPYLDELISLVSQRLRNVSAALNWLGPWVMYATEHARNLEEQANKLEKLLTDTSKFAEKAVNASNAYSNLAKAIKDALKIAQEADRIATDAQEKSQGIGKRAAESKQESRKLFDQAVDIESFVDKNLTQMLRNLNDRIDGIKRMIRETSDCLSHVQDAYNYFDSLADLGERANEAGKKAMNSTVVAKEAYQIAKDIEDELPGLSDLKDQISEIKKNLSDAWNLVHDPENVTTKIQEEVKRTSEKQRVIVKGIESEVYHRLKNIRTMLTQAQRLFNSMRLAMTFGRNSSVTLNPPPVTLQAPIYKDISLKMKTRTSNGMLFYYGKEPNRRQRRQTSGCEDSYALMVINSNVNFVVCQKDQFSHIDIAKNVSDGNWYNVRASHFGDKFVLNVNALSATQPIPSTTGQVYEPGFIVLPKESKMYFGRIPDSIDIQPQPKRRFFKGSLTDLFVDNYPVGLWNATTLRNPGASLAPEENIRDKGYMFYGDGVLQMRISSSFNYYSFKFRTKALVGVLFVIQKRNIFQALELKDGKVVFTFTNSQGQSDKRISNRIYNDNKFHKVLVSIFDLEGTLSLYDPSGAQDVVKETFKFDWKFFNPRHGYLGGIPLTFNPPANVTSVGLDGCIREVQLINERTPPDQYNEDYNPLVIDANGQNFISGSAGYYTTCHSKPIRMVTFTGPFGFVKMKRIDFAKKRVIGFFSFRTIEATGLFIHQGSRSIADRCTISIKEGRVQLAMTPAKGRDYTVITDRSVYNDGKWHNVRFSKENDNMKLYVDDEYKETRFGNMKKVQTDTGMFVGGVPSGYNDNTFPGSSEDLRTMVKGSIRDLTVNGRILDFWQNDRHQNVMFGEEDQYLRPEVINYFKKTEMLPSVVPTMPTTATQETVTAAVMTTDQSTTPSTTMLESTTESTAMPTTTTEPSTTITTATEPSTTIATTKPSTTIATTEPSTTIATTEPSTSMPTTSTTNPPPTTAPPKCTVSAKPPRNDSIWSFGLPGSYAVYSLNKLTSLKNSVNGKKTRMKIDIKTASGNGLILFGGTTDFIALYIFKGKLVFSFNAGGGVGAMETPGTFNDGSWHTVSLWREGKNGRLTVDGTSPIEVEAPGTPSFVNAVKELYIGGLAKGVTASAVPNDAKAGFQGCIHNFLVNEAPAVPPTSEIKIKGCYESDLEKGVSFGEKGGYVVIGKRIEVGVNYNMKLMVKPRSADGVIFSITKGGDYFYLVMVEGKLSLHVNNGAGDIAAEYTPVAGESLCDGSWHSIVIEKKAITITLTVDGTTVSKTGPSGATGAGTYNRPFYVGGVPDGERPRRLTVTGIYSGCIRDVFLKTSTKSSLPGEEYSGDVSVGCAKPAAADP